MSQLPAAGWFPDPEHRGALRYWDGTAWTDHRHGLEPVIGAPALAASGVTPQTAASRMRPPAQAALRQAIALVMTVVITIASVIGLNKVIDARTSESEAPLRDSVPIPAS